MYLFTVPVLQQSHHGENKEKVIYGTLLRGCYLLGDGSLLGGRGPLGGGSLYRCGLLRDLFRYDLLYHLLRLRSGLLCLGAEFV